MSKYTRVANEWRMALGKESPFNTFGKIILLPWIVGVCLFISVFTILFLKD